jgi:hypothetical protein
VVFPELQKRQMVRARKRRLRTSVLKSLASSASPFGSLLLHSGDINDEVMLPRRRHPHAAVLRCQNDQRHQRHTPAAVTRCRNGRGHQP